MGTLVRAIAPGSFNGSRIRVGKEFVLPDGMKPGHWLEVVKTDTPAKSKADAAAEAKTAAEAKAAKDAADAAAKNAELRGLAPKPPAGKGKAADDLA